MTYDSALWTGRKSKRSFPKFYWQYRGKHFGIIIGTLWAWDAYGITLFLGNNPNRREGERFYRWDKTWVWLTAERVMARG